MELINNYNNNPYIEIINTDFYTWNNIGTSEEFQDWKSNVPKLGTYNTINIEDFINRNKSELIINNSFALDAYLKEIKQ